MQIGAIGAEITKATDGTPSESAPSTAEPSSRALVVVAPAARREPPVILRQAAPFLAHLIAMKGHHPQTRLRRRAEPGEAITAYRTVEKLIA